MTALFSSANVFAGADVFAGFDVVTDFLPWAVLSVTSAARGAVIQKNDDNIDVRNIAVRNCRRLEIFTLPSLNVIIIRNVAICIMLVTCCNTW
ncbi:hypothetical protein [Gluconacetobacter tumulisoli]|uniref:Uncharacterized protein n=1 Tax=Gluconacetobacter tumulisoli TaxID=1286189 RepID=A0A7W4KAM2_9PROT|nr:hypothetical protein [Gluconacetobacter tumulisoli]MBB2203340.1 hypothetical protein [Gluconacetobacter tumulisoli]